MVQRPIFLKVGDEAVEDLSAQLSGLLDRYVALFTKTDDTLCAAQATIAALNSITANLVRETQARVVALDMDVSAYRLALTCVENVVLNSTMTIGGLPPGARMNAAVSLIKAVENGLNSPAPWAAAPTEH